MIQSNPLYQTAPGSRRVTPCSIKLDRLFLLEDPFQVAKLHPVVYAHDLIFGCRLISDHLYFFTDGHFDDVGQIIFTLGIIGSSIWLNQDFQFVALYSHDARIDFFD